MDKELLVEQAIEKLKQDLAKQGFAVGEHRTIPTYIGFKTYPVQLGLVMPGAKWGSLKEEVHYLGQRKRAVLTDEEWSLIGTIFTYPTTKAMNEDMDEQIDRHLVVSDW